MLALDLSLDLMLALDLSLDLMLALDLSLDLMLALDRALDRSFTGYLASKLARFISICCMCLFNTDSFSN